MPAYWNLVAAFKPEGRERPMHTPIGRMWLMKARPGYTLQLNMFPGCRYMAFPAQGKPGEYNITCLKENSTTNEKGVFLPVGTMWPRTKNEGFVFRLNMNPLVTYIALVPDKSEDDLPEIEDEPATEPERVEEPEPIHYTRTNVEKDKVVVEEYDDIPF